MVTSFDGTLVHKYLVHKVFVHEDIVHTLNYARVAGMVSAEYEPEPESSQLLDDHMCFALYAASRAVTGLYRPQLEALGLTYPQYLVLLVLWAQGSVSVKEVGVALQLDYGTLTPLLKRLESNGLLRRDRCPSDERTVMLTLTAEGAALREHAYDIPTTIAEAMGLDPQEFERTLAAVRRLTTNVADYTATRRTLAGNSITVDLGKKPLAAAAATDIAKRGRHAKLP